MARSKSKTADEWRRFKKFELENDKLKKEVSKLRKMINSLVLDQLEERVKKIEDGKAPVSHVCEVCGNDDLYKVPLTRPDGSFEIRICRSCNHRSQLKKVKKSTTTSVEKSTND